MKDLISCDEAVEEIRQMLLESDADTILQVYNDVMFHKAKYVEDSMIEVDRNE